MPRRAPPADHEIRLDALLEDDPFRFTRTDLEIARYQRRVAAERADPHRHMLAALVGGGEGLDEPVARSIWRDVIAHRKEMSRALGRQVPLRAAAIDWLYLRAEHDRPFRPIMLSKATLAAAVEESRTDPLTGLARRARFERAVARELTRDPFVGGSVVYIDLDGFKRANDQLGHARGDAALRAFALAARRALRAGDIAGRVGGDEFALLLATCSAAVGRRIARRLRAEFEEVCGIAGVSFSFGVAEAKAGESVAAVMGRADRAMYRQKRARRAR